MGKILLFTDISFISHLIELFPIWNSQSCLHLDISHHMSSPEITAARTSIIPLSSRSTEVYCPFFHGLLSFSMFSTLQATAVPWNWCPDFYLWETNKDSIAVHFSLSSKKYCGTYLHAFGIATTVLWVLWCGFFFSSF